jgi:hypothetical protein
MAAREMRDGRVGHVSEEGIRPSTNAFKLQPRPVVRTACTCTKLLLSGPHLKLATLHKPTCGFQAGPDAVWKKKGRLNRG